MNRLILPLTPCKNWANYTASPWTIQFLVSRKRHVDIYLIKSRCWFLNFMLFKEFGLFSTSCSANPHCSNPHCSNPCFSRTRSSFHLNHKSDTLMTYMTSWMYTINIMAWFICESKKVSSNFSVLKSVLLIVYQHWF